MRFNPRIAFCCPEYLHKQYAPDALPEIEIRELNPILEDFKINGLRHDADEVCRILICRIYRYALTGHRGGRSWQRTHVLCSLIHIWVGINLVDNFPTGYFSCQILVII